MDVTTVKARFDDLQLVADTSSIGQLSDFSLVLDCTDNPQSRYLLSDACVDADVTLVSGGAVGLEGWSGVWNLPFANIPSTSIGEARDAVRGPCLRCVYPQSTQDSSGNCEDDGILGTVVGIVGTLMANDAIKLLTGNHGSCIMLPYRNGLSTSRDRAKACDDPVLPDVDTYVPQYQAQGSKGRLCWV